MTLAALVVLAGCAPGEPATPATPVPPGVSVSLVQGRLDIARGLVSLKVHNGGAEPVRVTSADYVDPRFADAVQWTGEARIPAGRTRDLRVDVPGVACPAGRDAAPARAHLRFRTAQGESESDYPVADPFDFVAASVAVGCFAQRVEEGATIRLVGVTTRSTAAGDVAVLELEIAVTGDEPVVLDSVGGTVLLHPASGALDWATASRVEPGATTVLELETVPARCDPHAVAEDKVGTRFAATVTVLGDDPVTGEVVLVATDEQRGDLYDYVRARCDQEP